MTRLYDPDAPRRPSREELSAAFAAEESIADALERHASTWHLTPVGHGIIATAVEELRRLTAYADEVKTSLGGMLGEPKP